MKHADTTTPIGNVVDYLFEHCLRPENVDRAAYYVDERTYSFREVHQRVGRTANYLVSLGIRPDDRVMLSVLDGADFTAAFLGGMTMGAIAIPINIYLKPADYLYYLNDSQAKAIFIDRSLVPTIQSIKGSLTHLRHIVVTGAPEPGYPFFDTEIAAHPEAAAVLPRHPDQPAFWLYSSGSTGAPKGVVHTHAHIYWATELFGLGSQKIDRDDVIQCPPKMFFAYGLGNQVYFPLRAAATVVVNQAPATAERLWNLWLRHEPTIVMSVPTLFAGMLNLAEKNIGQEKVRKALHRLRFAVSGGEVLPPAVYQRWLEFTGTEILNAVGTTEMTHMFMFSEPGKVVLGSSGKIVPGYRAEIVDDAGRPVADGEVGNLVMYGPSAAREYWNKPDKTAQVMGNGGVFTGDKFSRDAEGNYFFVGRSDDMLRVGGVWVSPAEVESALCQHPKVLECAVVGAPDDNQMIKPKAYVVLKQALDGEPSALESELKEFCRSQLAHIKCPRWIVFTDALPKTATGKIQRFRLRDDT